jgi:hypothetical protein
MKLAVNPSYFTLIGFCFFAVAHSAPLALAQEAAPSSGSGPSCVITGLGATVVKDTPIMSAEAGGEARAVFSGARAPLKATKFPADASTGRMVVNTGSGFRVEGYADPRAFGIYASRDIPIGNGQLWVSAGRQLNIVGAAAGQVKVEIPARGGLASPIQVLAPCDALSFDKTSTPGFETPGNARGYVPQKADLEFFPTAKAENGYTVSIAGGGSGMLLWGKEQRSGFVHVVARGDLVVDGWVRASDLKAIPRGEMMDQALPPERVQSAPSLSVKDHKGIITAPKAIPLYFGRGEATPQLGEIEKDAEVYLLETVLGWASILPKTLQVLPQGDRAFWVKSADLGLPSAAPVGSSKP